MPCLVGCTPQFQCGTIKRAIEGDNIAPYAKIFFGEDPNNPDITVGNNSAPQWSNTAVIKSLQVGGSDGVGVRVEILDERGGSFHLFAEKIAKCMEKTQEEAKMGIEWGWVVSYCDGTYFVNKSPIMYFLPTHLEVNFAEGKVKFIINGTDLMQAVFAARHDEIEGNDDLKMPLKQAIRELANKNHPKFDVEFLRKENDGTFSEFGFKADQGGFNGPKAVWTCDGQNKLATIRKWLEPFRTDRDKGIIAVWDASESRRPTLVLMEDPQPACGESLSICSSSVGTYLVNAGSCSPVISFTPTINFVKSWANLTTGGNAGGAGSGEAVKKEKICSGQTEETGILQNISINGPAWDVFGPKRATEETQKGQEAHTRANLVVKDAIRAELRVQGDPSPEFVHPKLMLDKFVSLVVINPFHIFGSGETGCGDWLAQPGCNEVLSNRNWKITGADHMIKEGSYITTLQLTLISPGTASPGGIPFGGPNSGGYVPENSC
ncbi:MAG: hypothetical protein DWQ19_12605 [Crenarchaeota archaeon]|nr:MAG: hypothetical protein DWQ19_12605 [Thermoproteota archaeon]